MDSRHGLARAILHGMKRVGKQDVELDRIRLHVGPPIHRVYREVFGLNESETRQALIAMREYWAGQGVRESELYPGADAMLRELNKRAIKLAVATGAPHELAQMVVNHFAIADAFHLISGCIADGVRDTKAEIIETILGHFPEIEPSQVVMVGDREVDIVGAKANRIASIGVTWGFGSREELTNAGADQAVDSVGELVAILQ